MNFASIRKDAFAMPVHNPAYPRPPYRFINREFFIISYETDFDALRAVVPEPLHPENNLVHYEFIRMPDSSGFGNYTESGQVISVRDQQGRLGNYTHSMYLDDEGPIAGGREIWGFPKKLARPTLNVDGNDTLLGTSTTEHNVSQPARWASNMCRSTSRPNARSLQIRRITC
jgi:acetoacetate decarboxylase